MDLRFCIRCRELITGHAWGDAECPHCERCERELIDVLWGGCGEDAPASFDVLAAASEVTLPLAL